MTATPAVAEKKVPKAKKIAKVKPEKAGRAPKDGLRTGQVRILAYLAKAKGCPPRKIIAEKSGLTTGWVCNHIGPNDAAVRSATEKRTGYPSLLTLKLVRPVYTKVVLGSADKGRVETGYEITALGRKALEKAEK